MVNINLDGVRLVILTVFIAFFGCSNENLEDIHPGIYDPPTAPCDTAAMTYNNDMKPLFLGSCGADRNTCHKGPNTHDVNLDNYFDARNLGVDGDLMMSVLHENGVEPMPPDGNPPLSQCNINKIQNWVDRGCPQ